MSPGRRTLRRLRRALTSRTTLALFAFLALTSQLPAVVDIYASPIYRVLFLPSYLVSLLLYDSPFGLGNFAYPISATLQVDGRLLWEVGQVVTFYSFAVAVGWCAEWLRARRRSGKPELTP